MSHGELRKEKDCLNCGTMVQGPYCQNCGQKNIVPHETFWNMVKHFFYDITHFDGSFFNTLKILVFKPGFLSKEYINGRRKTYLHPIRMYVFTSAVFFLIFFSLYSVKESDINISNSPVVGAAGKELKKDMLKEAETKNDSLNIEQVAAIVGIKDSLNKADSNSAKIIKGKAGDKDLSIDFGDASLYSTVIEYDSIQKTLSKKDRDGFFNRLVTRKLVEINERYTGKEGKLLSDVINKLFHTFPYLLFISLPLFALFLKLLYVRRKSFYYADHGIFMVHLYIFTFIFLLVVILFNNLADTFKLGIFSIIEAVFYFAGLFYTLKAFRNFYKQGWGKTILKFILFNLLCIIAMVILFGVFSLFSIFQI